MRKQFKGSLALFLVGGLLVCNTDNAAYAKAKTSDDSRTVYGGSIKTVKSDKKSGNNAVAQQVEKDSDKDGVADYLEEYFGTSKYRSDTDRDGISDYDELFVLNLNPKKKDSDSNGKNDGSEDSDKDGLSNSYEIKNNMDPAKKDSDSDGLSDRDELKKYSTNPLEYDTDADGVSDGAELDYESDPLTADKRFSISVSPETDDDMVIDATVNGKQAESLSVTKYEDDFVFEDSIAGYLGSAYDVDVDGQIKNATIEILLDNIDVSGKCKPTIYSVDEQNQTLKELKTSLVDNKTIATAKATVNESATYVLADKNELGNVSMVKLATPMLAASGVASYDSDYDGRPDSTDLSPNNNHFTGKLDTGYSKPDVAFNMDYRWFFGNNTIYNKDLSVISSLLSSAVYESNTLSIKDASGNDTTAGKTLPNVLSYFGMSKTKVVKLKDTYTDSHVSDVGLGYRTVEYNGVTKNVVAVVVRGTNGTIEEWSSNFDIGNKSKFSSTADWVTVNNHQGFDVPANRIMKIVTKYLNDNNLNASDCTFWITGHSRGGAIANIIGAYYEKAGRECFTYTYASPNTTMNTNVSTYRTIFNIVNGDDFVPCLPMQKWGYKRYGRSAVVSVADNYEKKWEDLTGIWDYDPDTFGMQDTVDELAGIIKSGDVRTHAYKLTCKCHGDGSLNNITITNYGTSKSSREKAIAKIPANALPHCAITRYNGWGIFGWDFKVCQTPEYFMQLIAAQMAGTITTKQFVMDLNIADRYESAKTALIKSAIGGLEHPHYTESYYILADNIQADKFS